MEAPARAAGAPPSSAVSEALQQHLDDFTQQGELSAAEAALPGKEAFSASVRLVKLQGRIHALNKKVAEIEHRLEGMRSHLTRQQAAQQGGINTSAGSAGGGSSAGTGAVGEAT
ncbi:expressed protein [Chlorella variabilis]|uniref:Expressed protein n=1 Tax=Chlorella variabilis TaxID=554065 RepID=E1Z7Z5_CHLVA|nr:expressed protein [Chlorella variabilis]EFN58254.1 expressed protein [Chlorella variabilis]|eukprot:XP_005850356.1 expressed protein [Chlorella variabilis]